MERPTSPPVTAPRAATFSDRIAAVRRRRLSAIAVASGVIIIAALVAFLWPPTYRSTGTILIEQQDVPVELVRSTVSSYADQRIQVISQRVMSTENLMRIIDRYDLYPDSRRRDPREALIERMRNDIKFSMISADVVDPRLGRPTKATIAFSVSYDSRSPALAAKVANELTTLYLNENLESRRQLTENAAIFLTAEAERLNKQIAELDAKLARFKERNVGALPEMNQYNQQLMTRTEEELRETDTRIRSLDQQIVFLEAQLVQLEPASQIFTETGQRILSPADRLKMLKSEYARANAVYAPDHPDIVRMRREIEGLEKGGARFDVRLDLARQLKDAQGELAQLREKYAPDHPDVQNLERLVSSIEQTMQAPVAPLEAETSVMADNPAWIQVNSQREASVNERTSLVRKRAVLQERIEDLELRLSQSPEVAREYGALVRDLNNAQLKYGDVRQKEMEATLAQNLEADRKGERFSLIEPPLVAEEPVAPNRPAILLIGLLASLGAALGTVALLDGMDTTVRGRHDLSVLLPVAPLAVLPWIETPDERALRAKRKRFSLLGTAASAVAVVVLAHFLYRPLDVLWAVAWRRLVG